MIRPLTTSLLRTPTPRTRRRMEYIAKRRPKTGHALGSARKSRARVTIDPVKNFIGPLKEIQRKKSGPVRSGKSRASVSEFCFPSVGCATPRASRAGGVGRFEEWFENRRRVLKSPRPKSRSKSLTKRNAGKWSTMSLEDLEMMPETQRAIARHVLADICSLASCTAQEVYVKMKILRAKYSLPLEKFLELPRTPIQIDVLDTNYELKKIVMERPTLRKTFLDIQRKRAKSPIRQERPKTSIKPRSQSTKRKKKKLPKPSKSERVVKMNYTNFPYMFYEQIPPLKAKSITCLARTPINKTKSEIYLVPCKSKTKTTRPKKIEDWLHFPEVPLFAPKRSSVSISNAEEEILVLEADEAVEANAAVAAKMVPPAAGLERSSSAAPGTRVPGDAAVSPETLDGAAPSSVDEQNEGGSGSGDGGAARRSAANSASEETKETEEEHKLETVECTVSGSQT